MTKFIRCFFDVATGNARLAVEDVTSTVDVDTVKQNDQTASSSVSRPSAAATDTKHVAHRAAAAAAASNGMQQIQLDKGQLVSASAATGSSSSPLAGALPVVHAADGAPGAGVTQDDDVHGGSDQIRPLPAKPAAGSSTKVADKDFVIIDLEQAAHPSSSDDSPAAAGNASASTSSRLQAILQQLRTPSQQLQRSSTGLSRSSTGSQQQHGLRECRICLAADNQDDIVQPCNCSGTVQHAHMECLKAWVAERCSLECELCGKQYKDGVKQQLEPLIDPRKRRARMRSAARAAGAAGGDAVLTVDGVGELERDQQPRQQISWTRFW